MANKTREQLVILVASAAHSAWQADYRKANGDKPRMKKTKDPVFLARGEAEVDIASLSYEQLPTDWQAENRAGAEVVIDCVLQAVEAGTLLDNDFVETASDVVHEKWLERNGSWAPPAQKLPYTELTEDEKEKDRFFVREAIKAYQN